MEYTEIKGIKLPVSRIILGCSSDKMRKGANCDELFDAAYAQGINTFDTARGYGKSEGVLGDWINRRGYKDKVITVTKGALHGILGNNRVKESCIKSDLNNSLARLNTNFIDVYLLHRDNEKKDVGSIVELMNGFIASGKIGVWGVSNWSKERIESANEYAYKNSLVSVAVSEPHYGLAEAGKWTWIGCKSLTGGENESEREWYRKTKTPIFSFSPLGGGFMSGRVKSDDVKNTSKFIDAARRHTFLSENNIERLRRAEQIAKKTGYSVSQIALSWVLRQKLNTFAIVGNTRVKSLIENVKSLEINLGESDYDYLNHEVG